MKHTLLLSLLISACLSTFAIDNQVIWDVNNLTSIGGYNVTHTGSPTVISTPDGDALEFNPLITTDPASGTGDRIQVQGNPIFGATEFTIELIFKPDTSATGLQPRVLHISRPDSASNATRTLTLETRFPTTTTWYGDTFIKSVNGSGATDPSKTHLVGQWVNMAMTYKDGVMKGYVNGVLQTTTNGTYTGLSSAAEVSLGGRMQGKYYLKGAIRKVMFTPQALDSIDFTYTGITSTAVKNVKYGYGISQNYPNPLITSSIITLSLPKTEVVQLDLYDTVGVKVQSLLNGKVDGGKKDITFNATNLASGIYFYTIRTESGFQETHKMIVVK